MIPYGRQTIDDSDIKAVTDVLKSDFLTCGPTIPAFEKKFATFVGSKYAVAVSNGTAALHLACLAAELSKGDELITTPMTFAASANCALYCNAKPVFSDINGNGLIDPDLIEKKITNKTKIIIPVHYGGFPCEMDKIREIASGLTIIEDASHAVGSTYKNSRIGSCGYSDMAIFSLHPVKHITTGEGGIITTNSKELYDKLMILRTHGITKNPADYKNKNEGPWYHEMQMLGYNYRLTDIQAALGLSQIERVNMFIDKRKRIAKRYDDAFSNSKHLTFVSGSPGTTCAYHLYVIKLKDKSKRLGLFNHLREKNIYCQVHYIPLYWHPYYQSLGYKKGSCPVSEDFYERIISIPIFPNLTEKDQDYVIEAIKGFFNN